MTVIIIKQASVLVQTTSERTVEQEEEAVALKHLCFLHIMHIAHAIEETTFMYTKHVFHGFMAFSKLYILGLVKTEVVPFFAN